jgi:hypothetical protein
VSTIPEKTIFDDERRVEGEADQSTAVAALMSLLALFAAVWGLHLRLKGAQRQWKEQAVMVRRRSLAMSGMNVDNEGRVSTLSVNGEKNNGRGRWSDVPEYQQNATPQAGHRGSITKDPNYGDEERLDQDLELAKRNSRDQEVMVRRAS